MITFSSPFLCATASNLTEKKPIPDERQLLIEEHRLYRIVFFRYGNQSNVTIFMEPPLELTVPYCELDGSVLIGKKPSSNVLNFELGLIVGLAGKRLKMVLKKQDVEYPLSWTFISQ